MKKILVVLLTLCVTPLFAQVPEEYRQRWAEWKPTLNANIEQYRKGDAALVILGENGKPLSGAEVKISQKSHAFQFGCNILVLGQLKEKNEAYEQEFLKLFNLATTTFCMKIYNTEEGKFLFKEGEQDVWRRPQPDAVLAFCQKHGLTMKGQPVIAGSWHPEWVSKDYETAKKQYSEWMKAVAERYDGKVAIFDLVNEAFCHRKPSFTLYEPEMKYVTWAFKEARKYFKKSKLEINEATGFNTNLNEYFILVDRLFREGAKPDSIGFQYHQFTKQVLEGHLTRDQKVLWERYNAFCRFGVPMYITEITIPSTAGRSKEEGEAIQAEVTENLYRMWFSIPNMEGIVYWNLCDGAAWGKEGDAQAGLVDENMREKPVYKTLQKLIQEEWNTQLSAKTDAAGQANFRGFYGKYDVTVSVGDKTQTFEVNLTKEMAPVTIQLGK